MKSTVEQLSPTRIKINVEVPFDELKPNFDRAYKKLANQVNIPGFRKGKAPARILENRLGRGVVLDEVVNEAIPVKYSEAVSAEEVRPIGRPEIEVTEIADGQQLAFTAEVDIRPTIELPDASEITVEVDDVSVSDEDVTEQLDNLRARFGTLKGVDRPAQKDDFVVVDLSAEVNGEAIEEAATTGLSYQIGSGGLVDGIDDALTGLSADESATFSTQLVAGDHANQEAAVTAKVTAVKERELPDADDEFAQLASEFDTLDELSDDLRKRIGEAKRVQQATQAREKMLEKLLEITEVPLPVSIVESEVEVRQHDAIHAFDHNDQAFESWLTEQGKTREEFEADTRKGAEQSVKVQLLLDAVGDAEELSVNDMELTQHIVREAQRFNVSPEEYLQRTQQANQLGAVYADVRRSKALVTRLRQITVTTESGEAVDLSELLGSEDEESAELEDGALEDGAESSSEAGESGDGSEDTERESVESKS